MEITWRIANLKRNQETGLVFEISFIIMFKHKDQKAHYFETVAISGNPSSVDFIPFANLNEDTVISWVKSTLGDKKIAEIENSTALVLKEKLIQRKEESFIEGLPWQ